MGFPGFRPSAPFLWSRSALPPERAASAPPIPAAPQSATPLFPQTLPVPEPVEGPHANRHPSSPTKPIIPNKARHPELDSGSVKDRIRHSGPNPGICKSCHPVPEALEGPSVSSPFVHLTNPPSALILKPSKRNLWKKV